MTPAAPVVSVCIPVFNTEKFVAQAIGSVLSQTYQDFEIIVTDNASTDATPQIVASFGDPRLRVVRNDVNIGPGANFNRAVSLARGRYLKVLCADDVLYPACLEKQVGVFENDTSEAIALVGCSRDVIDDRGERWFQRKYPGGSRRIDGRTAIVMTVRSGTNMFGEPSAMLLRAEAVRACGGFDSAYAFCIDLDLWCRLLRNRDIYMLSDTLCGFRVSLQSWSTSLAERQHLEFVQFIDDLRRRGNQVSDFDCLAGRARARINARLRGVVTRALLWRSRRS